MLRLLMLVMVLAAAASSAVAEVRTERVEYTVGGEVFEGVLAYDDAAGDQARRPGVLVCHEWWGNNEYSASRARQLAELGYVAFALDLYGKGKATTDPKQAGAWAGQLRSDPKLVRERAAAGLKVLAENERVDRTRLAVIGYCMGGTVALELARSGLEHTGNLRAVVAFHASNLAAKNADDNRNIKGSVLVCHGAADPMVEQSQLDGFREQMEAAGVDWQLIAYGGAVHAFTNPAADKAGLKGVAYQEAADRRSWAAMRDLFREKLDK